MTPFLLTLWNVLGEMAPYLLFGFLVAGILSVVISPQSVERHLGGKGLWPVVKATLFGIPLPLCSCGVIPVAASLRKHKASKGATTAFLLSTPQTGVDSIFVTLSLLGPVFAVFRPIAALLSGLIGGSLINLLDSGDKEKKETLEKCEEACCVNKGEPQGRIRRVLHYGFVTLPRDIARPMLAGLVVAGMISWLVPPNFFAEILGRGIRPKLVMMLVGIPVYVCATASVPIAAALIAKGISPGAALVFLMTGPATNVAAIAIIWKMLGKRSTVVYLGTIAVLSIVFGILLDSIFTITGLSPEPGMPWMLPGFVKTAAAIVLLAILLAAAFQFPARKSRRSPGKSAQETKLLITGMTCNHCLDTIRRALEGLATVDSAEIDLESGRAVVSGHDLDVSLLCRVIGELGYAAEPVDDSG